jgi:hypothetical protein
VLGSAEPVYLDRAPAQVALFRYDNNAFIVQNYLPTVAEVTVSVAGKTTEIQNLLTGEDIKPSQANNSGFGVRVSQTPHTAFSFTVLPHSYLAFAAK